MRLSVTQEGINLLMERGYREGGPGQWVDESLANALQAGAKNVHFGIETQGVEKHGVIRRYIADDGMGMSSDRMPNFLMSIGGSGKPISLADNFGQGFKVSCLPWNPLGVVVISWTEHEPEGSMMWLRYSVATGYGAHAFMISTSDDTDEDEYSISSAYVIRPTFIDRLEIDGIDHQIEIDFADLRRQAARRLAVNGVEPISGTVILLMGSDPNHSTAVISDRNPKRGEISSAKDADQVMPPDPDADEDYDAETDATAADTFLVHPHSPRDFIVRKINSLLFDIPDGVRITIARPDVVRKSGRASRDTVHVLPDGRPMAYKTTKALGLKHYMRELDAQGVIGVDAHGTTVSWYLMKTDADPKEGKRWSGGYYPRLGCIAVQYSSTVVCSGVLVDFHKLYNMTTAQSIYSKFGIWPELSSYVVLVVQPPKYDPNDPTIRGILPTSGRGMVTLEAGAELPWDEWGAKFMSLMPQELIEAFESIHIDPHPADTKETVARFKKLAKRISEQMRRIPRKNSTERSLKVVIDPKGSDFGDGSTSDVTGRVVPRGGVVPRSDEPVKPATRTDPTGLDGSTALADRVEPTHPYAQPALSPSSRASGAGFPWVEWIKADSDTARNTFSDDHSQYWARLVRHAPRLVGDVEFTETIYVLEDVAFIKDFLLKIMETRHPDRTADELLVPFKDTIQELLIAQILYANSVIGTKRSDKISSKISGESIYGDLYRDSLISSTVLTGLIVNQMTWRQGFLTRLSGMYGKIPVLIS